MILVVVRACRRRACSMRCWLRCLREVVASIVDPTRTDGLDSSGITRLARSEDPSVVSVKAVCAPKMITTAGLCVCPPDVITMSMHFCHSAKITRNPIFSEACTRVMRARSAPPSPQTSPLASSRLIPVSCRGPVFFLSWLCSRADGCILLSGRLCSSAHIARVGRARIL